MHAHLPRAPLCSWLKIILPFVVYKLSFLDDQIGRHKKSVAIDRLDFFRAERISSLQAIQTAFMCVRADEEMDDSFLMSSAALAQTKKKVVRPSSGLLLRKKRKKKIQWNNRNDVHTHLYKSQANYIAAASSLREQSLGHSNTWKIFPLTIQFIYTALHTRSCTKNIV